MAPSRGSFGDPKHMRMDGIGKKGTPTKTHDLLTFFSDPRVMVLGMEMEKVSGHLEKEFKLQICHPFDAIKLASEGQLCNFDLSKFNLEKLATSLLGRRYDFKRPEVVKTTPVTCYEWSLFGMDDVKFATVDTYLPHLMGMKLLNKETKELKKEVE